MSDARAAEPERLPWIANENDSDGDGSGRGTGEFGPWVIGALSVAALLLVLALAYWIAMHNWQMPAPLSEPAPPPAATQVPQTSKPAIAPAKPRAARKHATHAGRTHSSPVPTVRLPAQRQVPLELPRTAKATQEKQVAQAKSGTQPREAAPAKRVALAKIQPTTELSPRAVATVRRPAPPAGRRAQVALPPSVYAMRGPPPFLTRPLFDSPQADGRVIQVGAFKDMHQAKLWWSEMVRAYPQVGDLQPSVIEGRYPNGTPFYRFRIGTSSRANSVMLCQMMQRIELSCAVTGLPWRATSW